MRALIAAAVVALLGYTVWWYWRHPCVRWQEYACSTTYCAMYGVPDRNGHAQCIMWQTDQSTCRRCVERSTRD